MHHLKSLAVAGGKLAALLMVVAAPASAAFAETHVFRLDQSNVGSLPDGVPYLELSITSNVAGTAVFSLEPIYPFDHGANYGFKSFGFNYAGANALSAANFQGLASGWSIDPPPASNQAGFGKFDYVVEGNNPRSQLSFTVSGLGGTTTAQTLALFDKPSSGNAGQGNFYFAAHLAGFQSGNDTSAFFAGNMLQPVPEPEAYAMFLAGIGLLGGVLCKRRA